MSNPYPSPTTKGSRFQPLHRFALLLTHSHHVRTYYVRIGIIADRCILKFCQKAADNTVDWQTNLQRSSSVRMKAEFFW